MASKITFESLTKTIDTLLERQGFENNCQEMADFIKRSADAQSFLQKPGFEKWYEFALKSYDRNKYLQRTIEENSIIPALKEAYKKKNISLRRSIEKKFGNTLENRIYLKLSALWNYYKPQAFIKKIAQYTTRFPALTKIAIERMIARHVREHNPEDASKAHNILSTLQSNLSVKQKTHLGLNANWFSEQEKSIEMSLKTQQGNDQKAAHAQDLVKSLGSSKNTFLPSHNKPKKPDPNKTRPIGPTKF